MEPSEFTQGCIDAVNAWEAAYRVERLQPEHPQQVTTWPRASPNLPLNLHNRLRKQLIMQDHVESPTGSVRLTDHDHHRRSLAVPSNGSPPSSSDQSGAEKMVGGRVRVGGRPCTSIRPSRRLFQMFG